MHADRRTVPVYRNRILHLQRIQWPMQTMPTCRISNGSATIVVLPNRRQRYDCIAAAADAVDQQLHSVVDAVWTKVDDVERRCRHVKPMDRPNLLRTMIV